MKLYRNIALGIVDGLERILEKQEALRPTLSQILKQNRKWGSRDRRQLGEAILDIIRWKRSYTNSADLKVDSKNYYWNLLGTWMITKNMSLPNWEEFSEIQELKIIWPLDPKTTERKIKQSIPDWLDSLGVESFGESIWEKESQALNAVAPLVLRCNTLKQDPLTLQNRLIKEFDIQTIQSKEIPETLVLEKHIKISQNPIYLEGAFEIQDENSQRVAHWVNPKIGDIIVDSCAGSGGKSLHIAALMQNKGTIFALDPNEKKLKQLHLRALRNGVSNIQTSTTDNTEFFTEHHEIGDVVLVDAPCSGLGVLRRNPAAKWHMNPNKIKALEISQQEILQKNAPLVKKGGALVYATCSIFPNENQQQIVRFLESEIGKEFELIKEETFLTHQTNSDGFYLARLQKK